MRLKVSHSTSYSYEPAKSGLIQSLRMWPSVYAGQKIIDWRVDIDAPSVRRGASFRDGAGDLIETVVIRGPVEQVTVRVSGEVETQDLSGILRGHVEKVPPLAYLRASRMTRADPALAELSADVIASTGGGLDAAHGLAAAVAEAITYQPGETESDTTAAEALALGRGVCQDQAHALIAMAHCADMPARYVTGYLHATADGTLHQASHAWAEIHVDGLGWVGFDPANRCCPNDLYIRLGSGHDAAGAAPIRGMATGQGAETLAVDLHVLDASQQ
ncbi:transglutaminase family protein [Profundibacterium mesophilum]|uniref:Bacterial transglutaminase-like N-terminal region domain containing protein n=1 Tax=Profundibacterium mesophilum KAUST100406-0324 TaxID=1037889 RepID=A0A921TCC3_9RHOB|nr:transglutaminase family protein [Profundibacterium mesophilum]KAF0674956.1 Bacterial transglutaminase-like N-terminal region domain containing protein [Profundibacterium mesophilum KAUST100406-0324]